MTKKDMVRKHLIHGKAITGITALKLYGLYRLSNAIFNLRKEFNIKTEYVTKNGATYAKYSLDK